MSRSRSSARRPSTERIALLALGVLFGCAGTVGPTAGLGGATGRGGGGSTGGSGGAGSPTGGMGGAGLACSAPATLSNITFALQAADGSAVTTSFSDHVTVRSVDSDASSSVLSVVLARPEPNAAVTLFLYIPGMPDGYFVVGAEYDLALGASVDSIFSVTVNQDLTLSQNGRLMVLGVKMASFNGPLLPTSLAGDLTLTDGGVSCFEPRPTCALEHHAVQVVKGPSSVTIAPGETALVGTLSFVSAQVDRVIPDGTCDTKSPTLMAAFETNVCHGPAPAACTSGPSSCCGDTEDYQICQGGIWVCPRGSVLISSCTGYGMGQTGTCASGI